MPSIAVHLTQSTGSLQIAGRSAREHWQSLFLSADLPYRETEDPSDPDTVIDGRLLAMTSDELRSIALGEGRTNSILVIDESTRAIAEQMVIRGVIERMLAAGVVMHDPSGVWAEPSVSVAAGAVLWRGCVLRGATKIAAGAVIHPGAVLDDTEVGEGSEILPYSVCEGATVGPQSRVGPMAHLRPGAVLAVDVKVGNFVEVKKAKLQQGVRASHLSYIGDASVGEGANIGAGTITCNYDGYGKHETHIGPRAFIGSNTSLVAPVSVGEGAIVGAGSTVSQSVPDHALMVERAEERVYPGKARTLHERNRRRAGRKDG